MTRPLEKDVTTNATARLGPALGFTKASGLPTSAPSGLVAASTQENPFLAPSSPDVPPNNDASRWLQSTEIPSGGHMFKSAKDLALAPPYEDSTHPDDSDDWLTAAPPPGAIMGFQSAKSLPPKPDVQNEPSNSQVPPATVGFAPASSFHDLELRLDSGDVEAHSDREETVPAFVGFQTSSSLLGAGNGTKKPSWSVPSAEALAKAAERMERWQTEINAEFDETAAPHNKDSVHLDEPSSQRAPGRIVLGAVENSTVPTSSQPFSQPASQPLSQPVVPDTPTPIRSDFKTLRSNIGSPLASRKPFKSPLITKPSGLTSFSFASPLNPNKTATSGLLKPSTFKTPLKAAFPTTEAGPSTPFFSPAKKTLGLTPRKAGNSPAKKATFVTPFKPGMRPGEPGRAQLGASQMASSTVGSVAVTEITMTSTRKDKGKGRAVYFDLSAYPTFCTRCELTICATQPRPRTAELLLRLPYAPNPTQARSWRVSACEFILFSIEWCAERLMPLQ